MRKSKSRKMPSYNTKKDQLTSPVVRCARAPETANTLVVATSTDQTWETREERTSLHLLRFFKVSFARRLESPGSERMANTRRWCTSYSICTIAYIMCCVYVQFLLSTTGPDITTNVIDSLIYLYPHSSPPCTLVTLMLRSPYVHHS